MEPGMNGWFQHVSTHLEWAFDPPSDHLTHKSGFGTPQEMPEEPRDLANYELLHRSKSDTEHEATVRIPVGRATAWQLDEQTAANIQSDLGIVSENFGLMARPLISDKGMESIVLTGLPSAIAKARPEVGNILNFYRGKDQSQNSEAQMSDIREQGSTSAATTAMELPSHVKDVRQFLVCGFQNVQFFIPYFSSVGFGSKMGTPVIRWLILTMH
jgi:hypothetical protein